MLISYMDLVSVQVKFTSIFMRVPPPKPDTLEKPQPPASVPVVSLVSLGGAVLSWSGPCYDGGSAVLGYVVEASSRGPEPGDWRELSDRCKSTSYRVSAGQLPPQTAYRFRVRAYNAVGLSEPSPESPPVNMEPAGELMRRRMMMMRKKKFG